MSNLWERFEGIANKDEIVEAKNKFTPIEAGKYKATLESLEAGESSSGLPMVKGKFRTLENRVVFYNQMLQNINYPNMTAVNIAQALDFVGDLKGETIEFTTLGDFAKEIESIETGKQYTIDIQYATKDTEMKFPKIKIVSEPVEVTGKEEFMSIPDDLDGDDGLPFN